jgi:hypothetical protein
MEQDRTHIRAVKPMARSKITNGRQMLDGIDGRSAIARRLRDIVRGLLVEFDITTDADEVLVRQAATLSVLSEQLQAQLVRGELVDAKTITNLSGQLRRILADLRQRTGQRGPAPPSLHEHLASFGRLLGDDDDEGATIDAARLQRPAFLLSGRRSRARPRRVEGGLGGG